MEMILLIVLEYKKMNDNIHELNRKRDINIDALEQYKMSNENKEMYHSSVKVNID